jgi:hypothetical protein
MIIVLRSSTRCLLALGIMMIHDQVLHGCKRTDLYLAGYVSMHSNSLILVPGNMLIAAVFPLKI